MIEVNNEFRQKVAKALLEVRKNYGGTNEAFSIKWDINKSVFSRLKGGELTGIISDANWLRIGRQLNILPGKLNLKIARTDVYEQIEEDVMFCKKHSKAMIFVDICEIGKTTAAKDLAMRIENVIYLDGSQCKTKHLFVRALAQAVGVDNSGRIADIKASIKEQLLTLKEPIVIIDDAGDLKLEVFLELKEFWNGTEGYCAWYMIGDDSLSHLIEKAIRSHKPGFRALFSRFSGSFSSLTSELSANDRTLFIRNLIYKVLEANIRNHAQIPALAAKCMKIDKLTNQIGGLRRLESTLILERAA
ncbi:AAA family ATPase [Mucilaginibacter ximonensis]|uniref:AAA family ATPase n=1 Tax=Mucilaginibacter ximonensis TaxID=538021 RepID=A0ABW5YFM6_9SPHI